jgi:high-affinity Fe2+/Pb2+ permease
MNDRKLKRHPIRGGLFGLLVGFAAAYFAFFRFSLVGFDTIPGVATKFVLIILGGVALGIVWAFLAPARKPKRAAPSATESVDET